MSQRKFVKYVHATLLSYRILAANNTTLGILILFIGRNLALNLFLNCVVGFVDIS